MARQYLCSLEGILKKTIKKEIKQYLTESNHLFVSQFMPELTWSPGNVNTRNSVIIGLSGAKDTCESAASEEHLRLVRKLYPLNTLFRC